MRKRFAAVLTLAVFLIGSPSASAAGPDAARANRAGYDFWFNQSGSSPKVELGQGRHSGLLTADCDSDIVAARLMHVTWGLDRPVGNVIELRCNATSTVVDYELSGGEYYFYFYSGVDNTHVYGSLY
ncbi:hypothetical protein ADK60_13725 [Streptomyces sp. XY431]|uniref:hypothetical protein n=1 Tax=Streptomyces sp. XY431 TaxID=1415562 RepID=UPI0006AEFA53|nr:hypothetical protein [Streptomyces sp. XY431]KOV32496.1 hypothetical protein ADK60_13725 [Streptomyces sp. XY431]